MSRTLVAVILVLVLAAGFSPVRAQNTVVVGAPQASPFAENGDGEFWQGMAVDLWRMVAQDIGAAYEIREVDATRLVDAVAQGDVDVAIAVEARAENETELDYLMPFYVSTLAIAGHPDVSVWRVVQSVFNLQFFEIVLSLSLLLLVVGAIVWLIERRQNAQQFHKQPLLGLGDGFWWAGVTLTTIGYGDKTPKSLLGRTVAMLWMLVGLAVSAALTGAVVAAVNSQAVRLPNDPRDLVGRVVAVVDGGGAADYLVKNGVSVVQKSDLFDAIAAVENREVDAVATGKAKLLDALRTKDSPLMVSVMPFDLRLMTFAVSSRADPDFRDAVNRSVLRHVTSDAWLQLIDRYIPPQR